MRALAVLLATLTLLPLAGCTHRGDARSVAVDFLWVRTQGGRATGQGGLTRARVSLVPNPDDSVRVGVLEESPGSIGGMWRASVWLAAVMSALATGEDLDESKVLVEADGFIDGPSAGALMTAAMMAARRGVPVREKVTMTGTVNPDGTIGPVGGVPLKVGAAIRKGKEIIGYPIGQGTARDPSSGKVVNVVELARSRGAEAVEIDDVEAAYALLTGTRRKKRKALSVRDMSPDEGLRGELEARAKAWIAKSEGNLALLRGSAAGTAELKSHWEGVEAQLEEAKRYVMRGDVCAGYWHAISAFVQSEAAADLARFAETTVKSGLAQGLALVMKKATESKTAFDGLTARMRKRFERSGRASLEELDALEAIVSAGIHVTEAGGAIQEVMKRIRAAAGAGATGMLPAALAEMASPVYSLVIAEVNMRLADESLAMQAVLGRKGAVGRKGRERFSTLFTRAAQANLHYFESVYVDQVARSKGISRDLALQQVLRTDRSYMTARAHLGLSEIAQLGAGTTAQELAKLASGMASYFLSSSLVAQYDSFGLQRDATSGQPLRVGNEDVFWRMLALAERKAREHAARARKKTGRIPIPALVSYQIGRVYQARPDLPDKLEALEMFWRASMWSQLAANL